MDQRFLDFMDFTIRFEDQRHTFPMDPRYNSEENHVETHPINNTAGSHHPCSYPGETWDQGG